MLYLEQNHHTVRLDYWMERGKEEKRTGWDLFRPQLSQQGMLGGVGGHCELGGEEGAGMDLFCPQFC